MFEKENMKKLIMEFHVNSDDLHSPGELVKIFNFSEVIIKYVIECESLNILEYIGYPSDYRIRALQKLHVGLSRTSSPAEVINIKKGSWHIAVGISAPVILYVLKKYIEPVIEDAWHDSNLRNKLYEFFRNRIFLGSAKQIEQKAIEKSKSDYLQATEIREIKAEYNEKIIIITLESKRIVSINEIEKIENLNFEDFIEKLNY